MLVISQVLKIKKSSQTAAVVLTSPWLDILHFSHVETFSFPFRCNEYLDIQPLSPHLNEYHSSLNDVWIIVSNPGLLKNQYSRLLNWQQQLAQVSSLYLIYGSSSALGQSDPPQLHLGLAQVHLCLWVTTKAAKPPQPPKHGQAMHSSMRHKPDCQAT